MKKHSFASSVVAGEYTEVNEQEYVEQHTESLEPLGLRSCGLQAILAHIDLFFSHRHLYAGTLPIRQTCLLLHLCPMLVV